MLPVVIDGFAYRECCVSGVWTPGIGINIEVVVRGDVLRVRIGGHAGTRPHTDLLNGSNGKEGRGFVNTSIAIRNCACVVVADTAEVIEATKGCQGGIVCTVVVLSMFLN